MRTVKSKVPLTVKENADFRYVRDLPKYLHPLVCFYEYWRHSPEHIELVEACREAGTFAEGYKGNGLNQTLILKVARQPDVFPIPVLMIITKSAGFPEKPFKGAVLSGYEESVFSATGAVGAIPWKQVLILRRDSMTTGMSELQFFEQSSVSNDLRAISFDWSYTRAEIVKSLAALVDRLRPPQFPEPPKAGQKGRLYYSGAIPKLNQLAAYRMSMAGIDDELGGKLTLNPLGSVKGWKDAIRSAQDRIDNITKRPLF